jgi:hypothetical protein
VIHNDIRSTERYVIVIHNDIRLTERYVIVTHNDTRSTERYVIVIHNDIRSTKYQIYFKLVWAYQPLPYEVQCLRLIQNVMFPIYYLVICTLLT